MAKRLKKFVAAKEVRAIARERVGIVKSTQVIVPKSERKPKHKLDYSKDLISNEKNGG